MSSNETTRVVLVTPAFNEALNLDAMYGRVVAMADRAGIDWRWIIVDDHSVDGTFAAIARLSSRDHRVCGLRLARNTGSHAAIACGLQHARGDAAIVLASDLQDPPEVIPGLVEAWRLGAQVVWAVRRKRHGEPVSTRAFSWLYYVVMRNMVGLRQLPRDGSDCFLLDRRVVDTVRVLRERHTSLLALVGWLGFRQATIQYEKQPRHAGKSGWTLRKKIKLLVDSVTAFSAVPLALVGWMAAALLGLGAGGVWAVALGFRPEPSWSLPVLTLLVGLQLAGMAVLGTYLWRALDEARGRPAWVIEDAVNIGSIVTPDVGARPPGVCAS
ncbi:MAG: glycosyltransferase family 2 protein [Acidobacteriota bacterium]